VKTLSECRQALDEAKVELDKAHRNEDWIAALLALGHYKQALHDYRFAWLTRKDARTNK
jgi:hypothetical protein